MKGNKIMGILWIIIAVCLAGILVLKLSGGDKKEKGLLISVDDVSGGKLSKTYTFNVEDVRALDVGVASESVFVEKTSGNQVIVELYMPESVLPEVELNGGLLSIKSRKDKIIVGISNRKIIIKVPSGFTPSDFNIGASSGSLHVRDLDLPCDVNCGTSSGSVHITNVNCKKLDLGSSSGSVHIENVNSDDLNAGTSSGSIRTENSKGAFAKLHSSSGAVRLDGSYEGIDCTASSGSVHAKLYKALTMDSNLHSTSGSVKLSVPSDAGFNVKYGVVSGSYHNSITGTSGKNGSDVVRGGGPTVQIGTTSGSIRIE